MARFRPCRRRHLLNSLRSTIDYNTTSFNSHFGGLAETTEPANKLFTLLRIS